MMLFEVALTRMARVLPPAANIILDLVIPTGHDTIPGSLPLGSPELDLISFLFDDGTSRRPLDEVRDNRIREFADPIRSFVEAALSDLSDDDLAVVFWEDAAGLLKMSLRGNDSTVEKAKDTLAGLDSSFREPKHPIASQRINLSAPWRFSV
jgi:hypothetical protein